VKAAGFREPKTLADFDYQAIKNGFTVLYRSIFIAAHALALDVAVVTHNERVFGRVPAHGKLAEGLIHSRPCSLLRQEVNMAKATRESQRSEAQELMWQAMEVIEKNEVRAAALCREALRVYPDCVDALAMLAQMESPTLKDYVAALRRAIEAGRRDLGAEYFEAEKGCFWGLIETRPFMRALADLVFALLDWGTPERIDEAIKLQEEMLDLNPNDNQGMRDVLAACYLRQKRYEDAARLLKRYKGDWAAVPCWSRVLVALAAGAEEKAARLLKDAREQNRHVEQYLTGQKRRPRSRPEMYSPGDQSEAVFCADTLWEAWKAHPKAKQWLKEKNAASA